MVDWKDAHVTQTICYCKKVTKKEIIYAINEGARTLDDIRRMTTACTGDKCKLLNPSMKCCGGDIQAMIDYYAPFVEAIHRG